MPRFYYEYRIFTVNWTVWRRYAVFDRNRGSDDAIASCLRSHDAEKIVDALNAGVIA